MNLETISILVEIINRAVVALGILIGGAWTYLTYLRGRLFAERLDLSINGLVAAEEDVLQIVAYCEISNVGTRRVALRPDDSTVVLKALALRSPAAPAAEEGNHPAAWQEIARQPMFGEGFASGLEPAESQKDVTLLQAPISADPFGFLLLELRVYSAATGRSWVETEVVGHSLKKDN